MLQNVKPGLLSLVLVPVNMDNVHWGLMVLDVKNKEAYFDDGLGYSFSKTSYVFLIMSELQSKFPISNAETTDRWPTNWKRHLWRWVYSSGPWFYDLFTTSSCLTVVELQWDDSTQEGHNETACLQVVCSLRSHKPATSLAKTFETLPRKEKGVSFQIIWKCNTETWCRKQKAKGGENQWSQKKKTVAYLFKLCSSVD